MFAAAVASYKLQWCSLANQSKSFATYSSDENRHLFSGPEHVDSVSSRPRGQGDFHVDYSSSSCRPILPLFWTPHGPRSGETKLFISSSSSWALDIFLSGFTTHRPKQDRHSSNHLNNKKQCAIRASTDFPRPVIVGEACFLCGSEPSAPQQREGIQKKAPRLVEY